MWRAGCVWEPPARRISKRAASLEQTGCVDDTPQLAAYLLLSAAMFFARLRFVIFAVLLLAPASTLCAQDQIASGSDRDRKGVEARRRALRCAGHGDSADPAPPCPGSVTDRSRAGVHSRNAAASSWHTTAPAAGDSDPDHSGDCWRRRDARRRVESRPRLRDRRRRRAGEVPREN